MCCSDLSICPVMTVTTRRRLGSASAAKLVVTAKCLDRYLWWPYVRRCRSPEPADVWHGTYFLPKSTALRIFVLSNARWRSISSDCLFRQIGTRNTCIFTYLPTNNSLTMYSAHAVACVTTWRCELDCNTTTASLLLLWNYFVLWLPVTTDCVHIFTVQGLST